MVRSCAPVARAYPSCMMDSIPARRRPAIPPGVWALGFVSMLMDISSEMIHALLPVYMVTVMGTSTLAVGLVEGVAESTASIVKVFSGVLSDRSGKRKPLAALGYGLAALTKPVFPLAPSLGWLVAARFVDRVGKGIRGAPRDALVADLTPPEARGAAFGLRQALDTIGAFLGPLVAIALMALTGDDFRVVFWVAVLPAFAAVTLMLLAVRDPEGHAGRKHSQPLLQGARALGWPFLRLSLFAGLFTLARFSEAFLILRASGLGLPAAFSPAVLIALNIAFALVSYPAGAMSDRVGRRQVLATGIALLAAADLVVMAAGSLAVVFLGIFVWGLHMGLTQGLLSAMVADTAPARLRGTAFGVFHLVTGVAALAASIVAGGLWDGFGPETTFATGAVFAFCSLLLLPRLSERANRDAEST